MEDKIMKELNKFREKIDKIFVGKTPKITGDMDEVYDVDIYVFRHPGMGNTKQIISGNKMSIYTATTSYLEQLIRNGVISEEDLRKLCEMAIDGANGTIKEKYYGK